MIAIASILNIEAEKTSKDFRERLEKTCGYASIQLSQTLHLSWQTAENYDLNFVNNELSTITKNTKPLKFTATGLGIFNLERQILYIPVPVSKELLYIHDLLWNKFKQYSINRNQLYKNGNWIPHISVTFNTISNNQLFCAIRELIKFPIKFSVSLNSIDVLCKEKDEYGILNRYYMSDKKTDE